jgi:hypothetical protein
MYKVTFEDDEMAHTLNPDCVTQISGFVGESTQKNKSGWTITAIVHEDYSYWINDFSAKHPKYGYVKGNFETEVRATSKKAYKHFIKHHPPETWDYQDI